MLTINISELLLTIVSFFVLMFLLNRLLFKPVISFREQRRQRMEACFEQERAAIEQQSRAEEEARQQRSESLKEAEQLFVEAKARALENSGKAMQQAEAQAEHELQQAEAQARELYKTGGEELAEQRGRLAAILADRLSR